MTTFTGERLVPGEVDHELWNEHFARYAFARQHLQHARVLEAGCGSGYGAAHLAQTAVSVTAIDIAADAVRTARQRYPIPNLHFACASAAALPFRDASFDAVIAFEVIEHIGEWPDMIAECARVLAPSGTALISTPNRLYYTESRGDAGPNPFHVHEFECAEFAAALRESFRSVQVLLQNRAECMAFYPHRRFAEPTAALESTSGDADQAHFFLAVCSQVETDEPVRPFVYVPRAANVLRERELHIRLLEQRLRETERSLADLLDAHRKQTEHLEQQNRWALATVDELTAAREVIRKQQEASEELAAAYRALEADAREKAEWARATEALLNDRVRELAAAVEALHVTESTLEERTRWALDLDQRLSRAEAALAGVRESRWFRLGRAAGLGPELER